MSAGVTLISAPTSNRFSDMRRMLDMMADFRVVVELPEEPRRPTLDEYMRGINAKRLVKSKRRR